MAIDEYLSQLRKTVDEHRAVNDWAVRFEEHNEQCEPCRKGRLCPIGNELLDEIL